MRHLGFSMLCLVCLVGASLAQDLGTLIPQTLFEEMLNHRSEPPNCKGGFYTYDAFITAAQSFAGFAFTGDADTRKKEIAAFFAQTSHETTGGSGWGYCFIEEQKAIPDAYCHPEKTQWPCAPNKKYFGRGPIQLTGNENYGQAGTAIHSDLLANPEFVATDPVISFKTALWFWMTPQAPKPSCHDVITGGWTPSAEDNAANRVAGFGLITNIINGGIECGKGANDAVADRIDFYRRYCDMLKVSPGENLDCYGQASYPA